ncbi:hypothetical protein HXX76_002174 [Chlamydomonas incerta]|uniref:F-box domain-containing protein n=1 Tax=Chlamydomonas incerta TaxID=51695 RepID=A0A835WAK2_CHLIN|nr:hypothetical protein HXX76_002174 [Chlamydomonas incerta]|eukprot:KAG2443831.1 hypothetical protein HXX76_002174 [Chlamydomonas incerta]
MSVTPAHLATDCANSLESLPLELLERIAQALPPNDVACTLRLLNRAFAGHFRSRTAVQLSQPVPHHAFTRRFGSWSALRSLPAAQLQQLLCLTAASGSVENVRAVVAAGRPGAAAAATATAAKRGCILTPNVFVAAARAGQLAMCGELHSLGCPWNVSVVEAAAQAGHVRLVRALVRGGCPWRHPEVAAACCSGEVVAELCRLYDEGPDYHGQLGAATFDVDDVGVGATARPDEGCGGVAAQRHEVLPAAAAAAAAAAAEAAEAAAERDREQRFAARCRMGINALYDALHWRGRWEVAACNLPLPALQQLLAHTRTIGRPGLISDMPWRAMLAAAICSPDPDWLSKAAWLLAQERRLQLPQGVQGPAAAPHAGGLHGDGGRPFDGLFGAPMVFGMKLGTGALPQPLSAESLQQRLAQLARLRGGEGLPP